VARPAGGAEMAAMEQRMAKVFGLEGDAAWQRHANP
jgi:hypothetical protein